MMLFFLFLIMASALSDAHHHGHHGPKLNIAGIFMNNAASKMYVMSSEKHHFVPPFLHNASEAVQKQFLDIIKDGSQTSTAMNEKVQKWLSSQEADIKEGFENEEKKFKDMDAKIFDEVKSASNLTEPEKEAFEKMKTIGAKTDIPVKEQVEQITAVLKALSEEQQEEIHKFVGEIIHRLKPPHHGHGHGHSHSHSSSHSHSREE